MGEFEITIQVPRRQAPSRQLAASRKTKKRLTFPMFCGVVSDSTAARSKPSRPDGRWASRSRRQGLASPLAPGGQAPGGASTPAAGAPRITAEAGLAGKRWRRRSAQRPPSRAAPRPTLEAFAVETVVRTNPARALRRASSPKTRAPPFDDLRASLVGAVVDIEQAIVGRPARRAEVEAGAGAPCQTREVAAGAYVEDTRRRRAGGAGGLQERACSRRRADRGRRLACGGPRRAGGPGDRRGRRRDRRPRARQRRQGPPEHERSANGRPSHHSDQTSLDAPRMPSPQARRQRGYALARAWYSLRAFWMSLIMPSTRRGSVKTLSLGASALA